MILFDSKGHDSMKTAKVLNVKNKLTYSVPEAAAVLGIGIPKMREILHIEGFPALKVGGRFLIPKQALESWLMNAGH